MTLSTRALKAISSVSAIAVCGVSGVIVATDPKPAAAPLRPPVTGSMEAGGSIVPSVVDAPPSTHALINTYVS
jgi:hypothetical protein